MNVIGWGPYSNPNIIKDLVKTEPLPSLTWVYEGDLTDDS
jgi:hypothetical protein